MWRLNADAPVLWEVAVVPCGWSVEFCGQEEEGGGW